MPTYLSPGVYVEEIPSGSAPIAGVGTSTAGFIGIIAPTVATPSDEIQKYNLVEGKDGNSYVVVSEPVKGEKLSVGNNSKAIALTRYPVLKTNYVAYQDGKPLAADATTLTNEDTEKKAVLTFQAEVTADSIVTIDYYQVFQSVSAGEVQLCTNFSEFKNAFGDFSNHPGQNTLAHAVYGFFKNGGTRCYVTWIKDTTELDSALEKFEAIDEIAILAAPGLTDKAALGKLDEQCRLLGDRFAIFDTPEDIAINELQVGGDKLPGNSDYAGLYFPWIQVFDPVSNGLKFVPPSGHLAGIYARVDNQRGVHKAPANEVVLGAVGLKQDISKIKQEPLNQEGINCIRNLNGNIRVWGARTLGAGKDKPDFKYINIRRQFNYLRESIDEGTQWIVFEPNTPELWAKIRRNISAFLTNEWRNGALFGTTPQEAFFVKCDAETNPPEVRELGQVITEIGVAVIEPAEFVIFRLSQMVDTSSS